MSTQGPGDKDNCGAQFLHQPTFTVRICALHFAFSLILQEDMVHKPLGSAFPSLYRKVILSEVGRRCGMQSRVGQGENSLMQVQITLREKNNFIVGSTELLNFLGLEVLLQSVCEPQLPDGFPIAIQNRIFRYSCGSSPLPHSIFLLLQLYSCPPTFWLL